MQFFVMKEQSRGDSAVEIWYPENYKQGDADRCPSCGAIVSMLKWLPPYRVTLELVGKNFGDVVFAGGDEVLVSKRFIELWQRLQLTGLSEIEPVEIIKIKSRRKKREDPPEYFHVVVARATAAIDTVASGLEWLEPPKCMDCRSGHIVRWRRAVIQEGTWRGEDIFRARGLESTVFVTSRFKSLCEENGIRNAYFIPAAEYGCDFYPGLDDPAEFQKLASLLRPAPSPESNGKHDVDLEAI